MNTISRKEFLKFGAALPLAMNSLNLNAASNNKQAPKRIIFVNNSLGFYKPYFFPKKQGDLPSTGRELRIPGALPAKTAALPASQLPASQPAARLRPW